jgi:hypothetical protein
MELKLAMRISISFPAYIVGCLVITGLIYQSMKKDAVKYAIEAQAKVNPCVELMPMTGKVITSATQNGIIIEDSSTEKILVRRSSWESAGNNVRVSVALAAFCIRNMDGTGFLSVKSSENNQTLMSVKDGQVWD